MPSKKNEVKELPKAIRALREIIEQYKSGQDVSSLLVNKLTELDQKFSKQFVDAALEKTKRR